MKSANHGLPAFVRILRNFNNNGYYRLQKWAAIALARYLAPARGLDPWRRPKGSWALGTRMNPYLNKGPVTIGNFSCNLSYNFIAPLRDKFHTTLPSVTPLCNAAKTHCSIARIVVIT